MKSRIISALLIIVLIVASLYYNIKLFTILMLISAEFGLFELINIKYGKKSDDIALIKLISYLSLLLFILNGVFYNINTVIPLLFPLLLLSVPIVFYNNSSKYNINDCLYMYGIIIFLGYSFGSIIEMANTDIYKCIYIFVVSFITDTYAYIGGELIGKTKFTDISPKKTVEGTITGTIMGIIAGSVFWYAIIKRDIFISIIITTSLVILSEIGDLVFSSIKRYYNKKDYSNIIPGHGGVLDRFDSVIFVTLGLVLIMSIL